jgi:hypothetical protein
MFDDPEFLKYGFQDIPLDRDIYVMGEQWMAEYETAWREVFAGSDRSPYEVGYISYAAVRSINTNTIELSWFANVFDRFHEVTVLLPKRAFIICAQSRDYDDKPRLFVKDDWIDQLYLRTYSVFALVDAIGVKSALLGGRLTRNKLLQLRDKIDGLAQSHPDISFISFADSMLLKSNWTVGAYDSTIRYNYNPEVIIKVIEDINSIYRELLGMDVYAIVTQGNNEFYNDPLLHTSRSGHHISLNSLGLPFAQLEAIDQAVKHAIRVRDHGRAEIYMDESYYHSLKWRHPFDKHTLPKAPYLAVRIIISTRIERRLWTTCNPSQG